MQMNATVSVINNDVISFNMVVDAMVIAGVVAMLKRCVGLHRCCH
jgi:hypothetical protein